MGDIRQNENQVKPLTEQEILLLKKEIDAIDSKNAVLQRISNFIANEVRVLSGLEPTNNQDIINSFMQEEMTRLNIHKSEE